MWCPGNGPNTKVNPIKVNTQCCGAVQEERLTFPEEGGERLSQLHFPEAMTFEELFKDEWVSAWQEMLGRPVTETEL